MSEPTMEQVAGAQVITKVLKGWSNTLAVIEGADTEMSETAKAQLLASTIIQALDDAGLTIRSTGASRVTAVSGMIDNLTGALANMKGIMGQVEGIAEALKEQAR